MKIFKSVLFILLVILAQAIVGFLEYRYLSLTLGFFALILIIFVQGLQMILEYHMFSPRFNFIIKILFGFVVVAIMAMNINYLYLSREKFDVQDMENEIKQEINEKYQEDLARYNAELEQYNAEFDAYKEQIQMKKDALDMKYESEMKQYNSLLKEYKDQKAFLEKQINNLNSRASKIQRELNRWGVTKSEKENMQKELEYIKNEKPKLMKVYNELTAPTPPDRETLTIESFDKEKPIIPKKEDIKIEKDRRLEILYWLIAAILEFGSLALLILLNQTINDKKKPKEKKIPTFPSNNSEKEKKHYKNKKAKVSIENNISMVDDETIEEEEVLAKNNYKKQSKSNQANNKNKETTALAEREYTMEDIRFIIEKYNTPKQRKTFTNNKKQKSNNKKQEKIIEKEYVPNTNDSRYINNDTQIDKNLITEKNNNNKAEKIIKKKNTIDRKEEKTNNEEQSNRKNMITDTLNQLIELEDESTGKNNNHKKNNNIDESKIIYVYKEDERKARKRETQIKEAIEELRNMTMFQRKVFVEKLNKELKKPVSFKTLGVWASRDYIPTKKVDAVIRALGLDEEDSDIKNIH